jgi:predicted membrane-bound mannosyltransferase
MRSGRGACSVGLGPFYYHVQGLVFFLFGANDFHLPPFFGSAVVAMPLLIRRKLGPAGTIAAVAFIALSPTLVTAGSSAKTSGHVVAIWRYIEDGRDRWLYLLAVVSPGTCY